MGGCSQVVGGEASRVVFSSRWGQRLGFGEGEVTMPATGIRVVVQGAVLSLRVQAWML